MTEIERKALALLNEVQIEMHGNPGWYEGCNRTNATPVEALCRAIEQHEAFKQEVSDAVEHFKRCYPGYQHASLFDRFIIAKPDPLVVEAREICARVCEGWTDIPKNRAAAYRDGVHDDEADFAYALNALRKANERPTHD